MADDLKTRPADLLYDEDFFVWTQSQAEALRLAGEAGAIPNDIDWPRLSEEIGDMGRRDLRRAESLVSRIIEHLYLLQASQADAPRAHWMVEIAAFRGALKRELTPAIRRKIEAGLVELHEDAADLVNRRLFLLEVAAPGVSQDLRWSLPQLLGESDDPVG